MGRSRLAHFSTIIEEVISFVLVKIKGAETYLVVALTGRNCCGMLGLTFSQR